MLQIKIFKFKSSFVNSIKSRLRKEFAPQFKNGCRLLFNGKVMKSRHRLKHYGFQVIFKEFKFNISLDQFFYTRTMIKCFR